MSMKPVDRFYFIWSQLTGFIPFQASWPASWSQMLWSIWFHEAGYSCCCLTQLYTYTMSRWYRWVRLALTSKLHEAGHLASRKWSRSTGFMKPDALLPMTDYHIWNLVDVITVMWTSLWEEHLRNSINRTHFGGRDLGSTGIWLQIRTPAFI